MRSIVLGCILIYRNWSIRSEIFFLPQFHLARSGGQSHRRSCFILSAHRASHIISNFTDLVERAPRLNVFLDQSACLFAVSGRFSSASAFS